MMPWEVWTALCEEFWRGQYAETGRKVSLSVEQLATTLSEAPATVPKMRSEDDSFDDVSIVGDESASTRFTGEGLAMRDALRCAASLGKRSNGAASRASASFFRSDAARRRRHRQSQSPGKQRRSPLEGASTMAPPHRILRLAVAYDGATGGTTPMAVLPITGREDLLLSKILKSATAPAAGTTTYPASNLKPTESTKLLHYQSEDWVARTHDDGGKGCMSDGLYEKSQGLVEVKCGVQGQQRKGVAKTTSEVSSRYLNTLPII